MVPPPSSHQIPCAGCKHLRRSCKPDCVFAPHFPPDDPKRFARVHDAYKSSHVARLLGDLPMDCRAAAAHSLAWEAEMWDRNPLYGCILDLSLKYMQIHRLEIYNLRLKLEMLPSQPVNVKHPIADGGSLQYPQSAIINGGSAVNINFPIQDVGGHQFPQPVFNNGGSEDNVDRSTTDARRHQYLQSAMNNGGSAVNINFPIADVGGHHYPQSAINNGGSVVNVNRPIADVGSHRYSQPAIYNSGYNCPLSEGQGLDLGQASYGGYCEVQEAAMAGMSEVNVNYPIAGRHWYPQPVINNGGHRFSLSQGRVLDFGQGRYHNGFPSVGEAATVDSIGGQGGSNNANYPIDMGWSMDFLNNPHPQSRINNAEYRCSMSQDQLVNFGLARYHNGIPGVEEVATTDANGRLANVNHPIVFSDIEDEFIIEQYLVLQDPPSMGFLANGDVPLPNASVSGTFNFGEQ